MSAIETAQIPTLAEDISTLMARLGQAARTAGSALRHASTEAKNAALNAAAAEIRARSGDILEANAADMSEAQKSNLSSAKLDRLVLDASRVESIATGLEQVAGLPDPVGDVLGEWIRPNGLHISRIRVPLGVI